MKIYTKSGDNGTTSLLDGTRVSKNHPQLECFGTIDELNSYIGLIRDSYKNEQVQTQLLAIQNNLFVIGSYFANEKITTQKISSISENDIQMLEQAIDEICAELPQQKTFILPGGHTISSYCQIARTVCRRAERAIFSIKGVNPQNNLSTIYINRLSDYLFVLARKVLKDFNKDEITWKPSL